MKRIELFADSIMRFEGWREGSVSWKNRNPGNLRSSSSAVHVVNGYALFNTLAEGWDALLRDVRAKCMGKPYTRTSLGPTSTILEFFHVWAPSADNNHPKLYAEFVAIEMSQYAGATFTVDSKLSEILAD